MHKRILETDLEECIISSVPEASLALLTIQSDLQESLEVPGHCDDSRDHLIYCTLGQGIKFLNEKYREVHMPFIYTHSGTSLTYWFL